MPRMAGLNAMTSAAGPSRLPVRFGSIASSSRGLHHQVPLRTRATQTSRGFDSSFFSSRPPRSFSGPSSSRLATALSNSAPGLPLLAVFPFSDPSLVDTVHSLLLSVPLPAGYTIILLTLLVRTSVTLPVTLWQRARARRTREIIVPEMKRLNDELAGPVARECRKAGMGYEEYKRELKRQLATHQAALHKKHGTHPTLTLLAPLAVHIPVLVTVSMAIRRCLETGRIIERDPLPVGTGAAGSAETTPMIAATIGGSADGWAGEGFWWLSSLADADASGILPIAGGMVAMLNAGMAGKKRQAVMAAAEPVAEPSSAAGPARPSSTGSAAPNAPRAPLRRRFSTSTVVEAAGAGPGAQKPAPARPARVTAVPMSGRAPRLASQIPPEEHMTTVGGDKSASMASQAVDLRGKIVTTVFRVMAVAFIPIALQMPSALALYWTTSMTYTFLQSVALDWWDSRKAAQARA